jgi:sulfite reductase alpha subunit-like flavoprotein
MAAMYSQKNPFWAPVLAAKYLTTRDAVKQVIHLELDISTACPAFSFLPGEAFGVVGAKY